MQLETVQKELERFNVTDAAIAKLNTDYMALTVKGAADKSGYEIVKAARIDIKKRRVEVEKTRVTLKAESLEYGRRVDGEAKRITALLEPIETHLIAQEKIVDDEKARIKAEAEAKEAARVQARIERLESMGMGLIAGNYKLPYGVDGVAVPVAILKVCTDEQFAQFVAQIQEKKDVEDARVKAEEDARKAENTRLAVASAFIESERLRLEEISRKQTEEADRIKAEQQVVEREKQKLIEDEAARVAAIDRGKKRVEDEKQRAEEIEKVKAAAVEQARVDIEAKIKRQVEEKAAADLRAKTAAEKKAARAPDKEKLLQYADYIAGIAAPPDLKSVEAKDIVTQTQNALSFTIQTLREKAEAL
jgi:hypothetical protein